MESKLGIRLLTISLEQEGSAQVSFELFTDGGLASASGGRKTIAELSQIVSRRHTENGNPNYVELVSEAAKKLESDFKRVFETLSETYINSG